MRAHRLLFRAALRPPAGLADTWRPLTSLLQRSAAGSSADEEGGARWCGRAGLMTPFLAAGALLASQPQPAHCEAPPDPDSAAEEQLKSTVASTLQNSHPPGRPQDSADTSKWLDVRCKEGRCKICLRVKPLPGSQRGSMKELAERLQTAATHLPGTVTLQVTEDAVGQLIKLTFEGVNPRGGRPMRVAVFTPFHYGKAGVSDVGVTGVPAADVTARIGALVLLKSFLQGYLVEEFGEGDFDAPVRRWLAQFHGGGASESAPQGFRSPGGSDGLPSRPLLPSLNLEEIERQWEEVGSALASQFFAELQQLRDSAFGKSAAELFGALQRLEEGIPRQSSAPDELAPLPAPRGSFLELPRGRLSLWEEEEQEEGEEEEEEEEEAATGLYGGQKEEAVVRKIEALGARVYPPGGNKEFDWGSLAGYEEQKQQIEDTVLLALKHPEVYKKVLQGTRKRAVKSRPRAVLFEGPPGCGKTSSARVIASQAAVPLVYIPLESILSKWYGESERNLAKLFALTEQLSGGAIIFLDEVDSLATQRGGDMNEATRRVLGVLLRQMDGFDEDGKSIVIGATNRQQDLDPALLSRFDSVVTFGLPTEACRQEILEQYAQQLSSEEVRELAGDLTAGASGRDLRDICETAERRFSSKVVRGLAQESELPPFEEYRAAAEQRRKEQNWRSGNLH